MINFIVIVNVSFINPFEADLPFLYPLKISENERLAKGFLTFSGGIEMENWK